MLLTNKPHSFTENRNKLSIRAFILAPVNLILVIYKQKRNAKNSMISQITLILKKENNKCWQTT